MAAGAPTAPVASLLRAQEVTRLLRMEALRQNDAHEREWLV